MTLKFKAKTKTGYDVQIQLEDYGPTEVDGKMICRSVFFITQVVVSDTPFPDELPERERSDTEVLEGAGIDPTSFDFSPDKATQ